MHALATVIFQRIQMEKTMLFKHGLGNLVGRPGFYNSPLHTMIAAYLVNIIVQYGGYPLTPITFINGNVMVVGNKSWMIEIYAGKPCNFIAVKTNNKLATCIVNGLNKICKISPA